MSRIKQFFKAITAKVTIEEKTFVKSKLSAKEAELFFAMSIFEQRHAIDVARTAMGLLDRQNVNVELLTKACLLHDIGKQKGDLSILDKAFTVILHKAMGEKAKNVGRKGKGTMTDNFRHAVFVYFNHPERAAELLLNIGASDNLIEIIRKHHLKESNDDKTELKILRLADALN